MLDRDSWGEMSSSARGLAAMWRDYPALKIVSFPMSVGGQSLQLGASGALDSKVRTIAELMVEKGLDGSVIRVGWEHNGVRSKWASLSDPDSYSAYYRRIVDVFRSVSPNFTFEWNVNIRYVEVDLRSYPGDAYVDVIGMDIYNHSFGETQRDPVRRWTTYLERGAGLEWHRDFAAAHGKPMAYSEWGLSEDHLAGVDPDDPYFVKKMLEWIAGNDVAYVTYFHANEFRLTNHPKALAQYRESLRLVPAESSVTINPSPTGRPAPCRASSNPKASPNEGAASGYWILDDSGRVHAIGSVQHHGDLAGQNVAVVAMAAHPNGRGYWIVDARGVIYAYGKAKDSGDLNSVALHGPIRAIMASADGDGYWLIGDDGGVFAFGVPFLGSMGGVSLNSAVVSGSASVAGSGYWLVAGDGGVFSFGVPFHGSTGAMTLAAPVISLSPHPAGIGYWLHAADGGVFSFGVPFYGSIPGLGLCTALTAVELIASPLGEGYWILTREGFVYGFGDAPELGDVNLGSRAAIDMAIAS